MSACRIEEPGEWPEMRIDCDERGCTERLYVFADVGKAFDLSRALDTEGWEDHGADRHRCAACVEKRALPPAIEPRPGEPWQPVLGTIGGKRYGS